MHSRKAPLDTIQAGYTTKFMAIDLLGPLPEGDQMSGLLHIVDAGYSNP